MRNNQPITHREVFMQEGSCIVSSTDDKGRIKFVNQDFLDIAGFVKEELIGQPHNIIRHPEMPSEAFEDLWRDLKAGLPWSGYVKNRVKNGDHYWVHANAMPVIEGGQVAGYISIRSKPDTATTRAVDQIYQQFKEGRAGTLVIEHGRVVDQSRKARFKRYFERLGSKVMVLAGGLWSMMLLMAIVSAHALSQANQTGALWLILATLALGFVAASMGAGTVRRTLDSRVRYLDARLSSIMSGNYNTDVAVSDDELQNILVTVKALQAKLAYAELEKKQLALEKTAMQNQLADRFEREVGSVVSSIGTAATELQATAESMSSTAEETTTQSASVAAASEQATANVHTVAAATEELTSSIKEIQTQVSHSSGKIKEVVQQAKVADDKVLSLTQAAQKIGSVVDIIREIAGQTNLLALNATIEAARAGDAGKGFAVVATEVKSLAGQTAKATDEIAQQVAHIQAETQHSVEAIRLITGMISDVSGTSTTIASAVEEQGSATQEIARNVAEAAQGTQEVSSNITGVREAAQSTGAAANQVLSAAGELARHGEALKAQVATFLANVRSQ